MPRSPSTKSIAVVSQPDSSFYDQCIDLIADYAEAAHLAVERHEVDPHGNVNEIVESLAGSQGTIVVGYRLAPVARRLLRLGRRVAMIGTPSLGEPIDVPWVHGSHEHGGYLACRHLLDIGHRRILFHHPEFNARKSHRWFGIQRAIAGAQKLGQSVEVAVTSTSQAAAWDSDPSAMAAFLLAPDAPTAILCWNDQAAFSLLRRLEAIGIRVPDQVSVIGYDALPGSEDTHPPLTTVDGDIGKQAREALALITSPAPPPPNRSVIVMPSLLVRRSTAPPPR